MATVIRKTMDFEDMINKIAKQKQDEWDESWKLNTRQDQDVTAKPGLKPRRDL